MHAHTHGKPIIFNDVKAQLAPLLLEIGAVQADDALSIVLSSGKKSNFYFDMRLASLHPRTAPLLGQLMTNLLPVSRVYDMFGGMETGAVALAGTMVSEFAHQGKLDKRAVWVRKVPKGHGVGGSIAGLKQTEENLNGISVAVVEDTFTTGGSTLRAVEKFEAAGARVVAVIGVVDREQGAHELFAGKGYLFNTIYKASELLPKGFKPLIWD